MSDDTITVRFMRKPTCLAEVDTVATNRDVQAFDVEVTETKELTAAEYDHFITNFFRDCDWLAGKGGFKASIRQAIAVAAPERETLYVDPSGYSYARYVGKQIPAYRLASNPKVSEREAVGSMVTALQKIHLALKHHDNWMPSMVNALIEDASVAITKGMAYQQEKGW